MLTLSDKERNLSINPGTVSNEICGNMRPDQKEHLEKFEIDGQKTLGELVDALNKPDTNICYLHITRDTSGTLVANFLREYLERKLENIVLPYGFDVDLEQPVSDMNGVYFDRFVLPNQEDLEFIEIDNENMTLSKLLNQIGEKAKGNGQIKELCYLEAIKQENKILIVYKTKSWVNKN